MTLESKDKKSYTSQDDRNLRDLHHQKRIWVIFHDKFNLTLKNSGSSDKLFVNRFCILKWIPEVHFYKAFNTPLCSIVEVLDDEISSVNSGNWFHDKLRNWSQWSQFFLFPFIAKFSLLKQQMITPPFQVQQDEEYVYVIMKVKYIKVLFHCFRSHWNWIFKISINVFMFSQWCYNLFSNIFNAFEFCWIL